MNFIDAVRGLRRRLTMRQEEAAELTSKLDARLDRMTSDQKESLDSLRRGLHESFGNQSTASKLRLDRLMDDLKERMNGLRCALHESFDNQSTARSLRLGRLTDDLNERLDNLRHAVQESFDNQSAASNLRLDRLTSDLSEKMDGLCRDLQESFDNQSTAGNLRLERIIEVFEQHIREVTTRLNDFVDRQKSLEQSLWPVGQGMHSQVRAPVRPSKGRPILHPGFGHSGTTSLQVNLFSGRDDLLYCGASVPEHGGILSRIKYLEEPELDYAALRQAADDHIVNRKGATQRIVVSDENLVDQPEIFYTPRLMPVDVVARRLHWLFPDSVVLFTVRNQFDYVESMYFNLKKNYAYLASSPCPSFERWFEGQFTQMRSLFLRNLNYHRAVRTYADIFGEENVFVVPLELVHEIGERGYLEIVGGHLGLPIGEADVERFSVRRNARITRDEDQFLSGEYRKKFPDPEGFLPANGEGCATSAHQTCPATIGWTEQQRARVVEHIGNGNALLERQFGVQLSHYGYPGA